MDEPREGVAPGDAAGNGVVRRGEWVGLTKGEWFLLLMLAAVQFTHIVDFMIVMPLGPQFTEKLHLTTQQFGNIVSAYGLSAGLAGLAAARFIDRFDRRTALLFLYAGFTSGTLLCACVSDYLLLVAARTVTGAFGGGVGSCVLTIVGDVFPDSRRGRAMGVVMSAFSVATIAGVPAGLWLADELGWRAPFAVLGVLGVGVLVLGPLVLPPLRGHLDRKQAESPPSVLAVLTEPTHLRAYILMAVLVFSSFLVVPHLANYLVRNAGVAQADLRWVYLWGGAATLLTLTPIGRLADRWGKLPVFRVFGLLTVVPLLILTNLPRGPLVSAVAAMTLCMVLTSGRMVPVMALITASAAPRRRGSFLSVNSSVQMVGMALATQVSGAIIADESPGSELKGFSTVGLLAAAAAVLSVFLAGRLRPAAGGQEAPDFLEAAEPEDVCEAGLPCPEVQTVRVSPPEAVPSWLDAQGK
jgi:DHA1 family inner membrane transport protein